MNCFIRPAIEWKVTGDGLLTFLGGLFAVLAILYQVHHADRGLEQQLASEKSRKADETSQSDRAVAVAMLFELDTFFMAYIRHMANEISNSTPKQLLPLRKTPPNPFVIYKSNASSVGRLPVELVIKIVRAYSGAQWLLDRVADYQAAFARAEGQQSGTLYFSFARRSLEELVGVYKGTEGLLRDAIESLCEFTDTVYKTPWVAIAEGV